MPFGDINADLRHQGVRGSKLRERERRNRELTDAQNTDAELSDTHHATRELPDRNHATCRDRHAVGAVLERDVDKRPTCDCDFGFVLIAKAVPGIPCRIRSAALRARERLLRDLMSTLATRLHQSPLSNLFSSVTNRALPPFPRPTSLPYSGNPAERVLVKSAHLRIGVGDGFCQCRHGTGDLTS